MGLKKVVKQVTGGTIMNALFDPGRLFLNTKEEEAAENAAKQAAAERAQYEMQQRQLEQANALDASKVLDSVARVETGAGTDVADDSTALGVKKKKASTSTSLGVV